MKKTLMLCVLCALFLHFGCSDDNSESDSFLGTYKNTVWEVDESSSPIFIRFLGSESDPMEEWSKEGNTACFLYYNYASDFNSEVIENSSETFIIRMSYSSGPTETYAISVDGAMLTVDVTGYDGPNSITLSFKLIPSTTNVDELDICN